MSIEVIHFKESIASQTIKNLYKKKLLIPFFGAGFTKGSLSKKGKVPDAKKMISSIKEIALTNNETSDEHNEIYEISELKTAYQVLLDDKYIPEIKRRNYLENSFSNVKLNSDRKNILLKKWNRIYTFNIDDGIEGLNLGFNVICPFRPVSMEFVEGNKCLMKIHGDITEYIKYNDTSIVFSWLEYARSLEENKAMTNILESDAKNKSLLFVGCSLDKEIDLMLVAAKHKFIESIFLMKGKPSISDKKNLETYGVKRVIWFDDYDDIYEWLNITLDEELDDRVEDIRIEAVENNRIELIKYISNGGPIVVRRNEVRITESNAKRDLLAEVRKSLRDNQVVLIEGRRFSGKTTLAFDMYQSFSEYRSFIYHGNIIGSVENIDEDIKGEGKLFIVDTESIHYSRLQDVLRNISRENKLIIFSKAANANYLKNMLERVRVTYTEFLLSDKLTLTELSYVNRKFDDLGVMHYEQRKTLLDNAWSFYSGYSNEIGTTKLFNKNVDSTLFKVLLLLQNRDYVDEDMIRAACNENYLSIDAMVDSSGVILEKTIKDNTNYISCNAKTWSIHALEDRTIPIEKKAELISECIHSLVENGYTETADDLIRFSRLNEIFGGMSYGASSLIRLVHLKIKNTFSKSSHYWLQKSKCELIAGKTESDINNGILDAKKVINDNKNSKNRTYYSAILVLAQLRSKEFVVTGKTSFLIEMLDLYMESLRNKENNVGYIDKVKEKYRAKQGDIYHSICALKEAKAGAVCLERKIDIDYLISSFSN